MITMIMDTLPVFYNEKMVGYMPSSFAYLVFVGEKIEVGMRKWKFNDVASANPGNRGLGRSGERKKEGEPHVVAALPAWPNFPLALIISCTNILPRNITTQPISVFPIIHHLPTKNTQLATKLTPKMDTKSTRCTSKTKHYP